MPDFFHSATNCELHSSYAWNHKWTGRGSKLSRALLLIAAQQFSVKEHYILTAHHIHHISMSHFSRYDCQTHNFFLVDRMAYAGRVLFLGSIKAERHFKHSLYLKWTVYDLNIGFQSPCNSQRGVTCSKVQILVLMSSIPCNLLNNPTSCLFQ